MNSKKIRSWLFYLHRYLGLIVGIFAVIIGITGSILVFYPELDPLLIARNVGEIQVQSDLLPLESILNKVQANYQDRKDIKFDAIHPLEKPNIVQISYVNTKDIYTEANVNPYTGEIINTRVWDTSFFGRVFQLHYALLAGDLGTIIAGIAALFMFILSLTGLVLWPGWRKLINGFKIKWNARLKRLNFDLHKVVGIIVVVFLGAISFTGFCWNFYAQSKPLIYAATFSPKPVEPVSQVIAGKTSMSLGEIIQRAETALPGGRITYINLPTEATGVFRIYKKLPGQKDRWGSEIYCDRYTGKILKIVDPDQASSLGEAVFNSFTPIHYGTFGGLPTRLFYIFVGLSPAILFLTGLIMYFLRRSPQKSTKTDRVLLSK